MPEQEPQYFKEFREHIDKRFDSVESKIEKEVGDLAAMTKREFDRVDERFAAVDVRFDNLERRVGHLELDVSELKDSVVKIEGHIGRYEIRSQNVEQILLQDHKPRIIDLEKAVFA